MWTCVNCGTANEDSSRFCVGCGTRRPEQQTWQQPQQQPQQQTWQQPQQPQQQTWQQPQQPQQQTWQQPQQPQQQTWQQPQQPQQQTWQQPQQPQQQTWQQPQQQTWQQPQTWAAPPPPPKKSRWWVWLLAGLALIAVILVACYFTVHRWTPATCTEPETCTICHRTRGAALGHDAPAATCTEDSVCRRCGKLVEAALGHDWIPATYDAPETCSRCGKEQGQLKGYIGELLGTVSSEALYLHGDNESHAYVLTTPVNRCRRMYLNLMLTAVDGNPYGTWGLFARDLQGNWTQLATFDVQNDTYNNTVNYRFDFSEEPSFDALSVLPLTNERYTISYSFSYDDAQIHVD